MRILVTGASGQLGKAMLAQLWSDEVSAATQADLDIRDPLAVRARLERDRPQVVMNCAAFTDVDGAEDDAVGAFEVNAFAVRTLADAAEAVGAALVHFSTDFVFDGTATRPYVEEDRPNPRSVYACSKLVGEWLAGDASRHYVLRVESLFGGLPDPGSPRRTSVDRIVDAILEGRQARVFTDRTVSPSYTADVVSAARHLVAVSAAPGLYHCVNTGSCTWQGLAEEIGRQLGVQPALECVAFAAAKLRAQRPQYCALFNQRLAAAGFSMPTWEDALSRYLVARGAVPVDRSGAKP
jgi:dTDP-4-dehydrorhamnose reductase